MMLMVFVKNTEYPKKIVMFPIQAGNLFVMVTRKKRGTNVMDKDLINIIQEEINKIKRQLGIHREGILIQRETDGVVVTEFQDDYPYIRKYPYEIMEEFGDKAEIEEIKMLRRIVYAHLCDLIIYTPRSKYQLKLEIVDEDGKPIEEE